MAQSQTILNQGITEFAILMSDTTPAATALTKIVALNMATPCTAAAASTFADPADTATHHTDSGLQIVAAATVAQSTTNTTGDTIEVDHVFTASATKNVAGFHLCNDDGDVSFMECCFNAVLAVENTDTITIEAKIVLDQA
jgi:hypothetical protein